VTVLATLVMAPAFGIVAIPLGFTVGQAAKVGLLAIALAIRLRGGASELAAA
jgi:hypothetical protein